MPGSSSALELDADLVWLMDDDGAARARLPRVAARARGDYDFSGPAVVAEDDRARLCFPIRLPGDAAASCTTWPTSSGPRRDGLLRDVVIPFNGVLVTRDARSTRIGLPRAEFFIWGDDVEYLWRARRPAPAWPRSWRRVPAPGDRRPRHADDVRPDDVQPLARRT